MNRPVHFEIHAADPDRAQAFYSGLFGWVFTKWGAGDWDYWLIKTGEGAPGIDGGMIRRMGDDPNLAAPTPVIAYVCTIGVEDVDASVARALELGACVAVPKMAIKGVGWLAYCKDTEGNLFGVMCDDTSAA
jgi:predicted enzyme related to lactoylglutathione lyase